MGGRTETSVRGKNRFEDEPGGGPRHSLHLPIVGARPGFQEFGLRASLKRADCGSPALQIWGGEEEQITIRQRESAVEREQDPSIGADHTDARHAQDGEHKSGQRTAEQHGRDVVLRKPAGQKKYP